MKLNSIFIFVLSGLATLLMTGLSSCSSEELADSPPKLTPELLNLELSLNIPVSTRSYTEPEGNSNDGILKSEIESKIEKVNLYFCKVIADMDPSQDEIIYTLTDITEIEESNEVDASEDYVVRKIKKSVRAIEFATIAQNKKLRLYVAANTNVGAINSVNSATFSFTGIDAVPLGIYSTEGKYLPLVNKSASGIINFSGKSYKDILEILSGATENAIELNKTIGDNLGSFGDIILERGVARIDYKDISRKSGIGETGLDSDGFPSGNHIYPLGETGLYLKIVGFQPVNVSKGSYLFRHTTSGSNIMANHSSVFLFNIENGNSNSLTTSSYNWVADNDWPDKDGGFLNAPSMESGVYKLQGEWENMSNFNSLDFTPWRYISENTIPSTDGMKQGVSTGVAFKVLVCNAKGDPLTEDDLSSSDSPWYGKIKVAKDTQGSSGLSLSYRGRTVCPDNETGNYYLTYYYWIRHNNSSEDNGVTDPMEFAVVRNNIYQLSVTKFGGLPREYNPEDADETEGQKDEDLTLNVKVKAWDYYRIDVDL